ncbi:aspartyl protease family protein At5g10770-like [Phalaenopsis equestris]|uniref:aspartyl protease family protein At5g10770-like n=1 Tax=Phalaenopsis equestris TaxID=78828 RepID=UPI0009E1A394|nr:aspartyl protease family protein At5g10770-like [Phalaenopsis equestris]
MELLLINLCLFLLFPTVAPLTEVSSSSCSSQFEAIRTTLNSSGIHLPLHHRQSPCSPSPPLNSGIPFFSLLLHDARRVAYLSHRLTSGHPVSLPLSQGSSLGVGNYIARIQIGTPPKPFSVIVDTGSSLSWLQCLPCKVSCHLQVGALFDPTASSTYARVHCSASACSALSSATLNPSSCTRSGDCVYAATYGDSSFSVGYLSQDTLALSPASIHGFVFGCGQDNEGLFGKSDGLIGLAKDHLSLLSQLSTTYGNSFSYCLPSSSGSGYLSFGSYTPSNLAFTPMVSSSLDKSLYFLKLTGITVQSRTLSVSASVYAGTPTIIDSGTVITRLPDEIYSALSKAVVAAVGRKRQRVSAYSILDTCYVGSGEGMAVPDVQLVFAGGAVLRLPAKNVMVDVEKGRTCLAFAAAGRVAIIGNKQQEGFKVVYDVGKGRIGFAAGGCG